MSENNKITSVVKTKDPRKVEAGRLGAISRSSKKKAESAATSTESVENSAETTSSKDLKEFGLIVSVVGIAVGIAGLYYRFNGKSNCTDNSSEKSSENYSKECSKDYSENSLERKSVQNEKPKPKPVTKSRLDSLD